MSILYSGDSTTINAFENKNYICDLIILGKPDQPEMYYLRDILEKIKKNKSYSNSARFTFKIEFETQFNNTFHELLKNNVDFVKYQNESPIIYNNTNIDEQKIDIIGDFKEFIEYITINFSYSDEFNYDKYFKISKELYKNYIKNSPNKYAFINLSSFDNKKSNNMIVFELYLETCYKSVMNFLELCKGNIKNKGNEILSYKNCEVFRIAKNGFIQSGDLSNFKGSKCIFGSKFEDENYDIKHDVNGVIGYVKENGKKHSNECQFYITLNPLKCFDKKFVAFGRVIMGYGVIERLTEVDCFMQRPVNKVTIVNCGEYLG